MNADAAVEFERNCRQTYEQMARITVTPKRVRHYDLGADRKPRFLQELVGQNPS